MSSWLRGSWVALVATLMVGGTACQWEVPNDPFIDADVDATDPDAGVDGSTDAPTDGMPVATLTVIRSGTASGTVTSNAVGGAMIDCGATCSAQFPPGTLITLTETPGTGATFVGWSGVCTDTSPNCSFTLDSDTTVQATFDVSRHTITIAPGGNGSGSVTSNVGGIACPGVCAATVDHGTALTLTATPVAPSIFAGWNDVGCTGTTPCTFTVTQDENIDAAFALNYTVTVSKNGNGRGTVTSSSPGIDCGTDCDQVYSAGTMVTLNAAADADSDFLGWGGACTGTGSCMVTVDSVVSVTANFVLKRYTLTASRAGSGGGVVTSNPTGINCGTACEAMYDHGTQVTLSAVPDGTSTFSGWSDASCPGTSVCVLTMTAARSVAATFESNKVLTVTLGGNGAGTVVSNPTGIMAPGVTSAAFPHGSTVTLTAAANPTTSDFTGWAGACATFGTSPECVVTMDQARSATATFTLRTYTLTLTKTGEGVGTVTSDVVGINCGTACTTQNATFNHGQTVMLSHSAGADSQFVAWGGACSGGTCSISMTQNRTVTADFKRTDKVLTVNVTGSGTVTSMDGGIDAPGDATETYPHGTSVTLTAAWNATSHDFAWGGACTGSTASCTVTMDQARTVAATFTPKTYTLTLTKTGEGVGTVTSNVVGINCGTTCTTQNATFEHGQTVMLSHSAGADSQFVAWGGACSGATCSLTMTQNRTVTADFKRADKTLTVTVNGAGTVTSADGGINAPTDSTQTYPHGTTVTLTAAWNAASHTFAWGGACSGSLAMCTVTMDQARTVTATFTIRRFTLTVNKSGAGVGTVTSDVTGINCGTACSTQSAMYDHGQTVVLGHLAGADSEFVAWGGACSGASCSVVMTQDRTVSASFKRTDKTLTVNVTGAGTVTSMDGGIDAPTDPSQTYPHGTMVTLMAAWNATSHDFVWGGACSGSLATCSVTMDQARSVTATFTLKTWTLTVTRAGVGSGTVTSTTPAGAINCGTDCTETVTHGTMVTLTAAPTGGDIFYGWSGGGCSGTSSCTTTITAATQVTATFDNCVRSTQSCTAGNFLQCDATGDFVSHVVPNGGTGGTSTTITYDGNYMCPMGCNASQPRCNDISAVNGLNAALDAAGTSPTGYDLLLDDTSGDIVIDTGTYNAGAGTITIAEGGQQHVVPATLISQTAMAGFSAPNILALRLRTFTVGAGARVKVRGAAAFAVTSHFDIYIAGHLDLSGPSLGAGVSTNSFCGGGDGTFTSGAGGNQTSGGNGSAGGSGGNMLTNVSPNLQPLEGGCLAGSAGTFLGGRGGGAVQLVTRTKLTVASTGIINVSGFRGSGVVDAFSGAVYALGAGSGGGILVEAPSLNIIPGARLAGRGGSGGAGNRTTSMVANGNHGDWDLSAASVPGATCTPSTACGVGGNGGTELGGPGAGTGTSPNIGGGGGAVGRCHIRSAAAYVPPSGTAKIHVSNAILGSR